MVFRLRKRNLVLARVRVPVRAAPWIARREPPDGDEKGGKGGEKGRAEGTYRQPAVAASPTPSTVPRANSNGGGESGEEGGGGRRGGGVGGGGECRWQGRP